MALEDLFGNNALVKVLDFLLENRFWDYTKKDIAEHSKISRTELYRLWNTFMKLQLVKESRKIGATTLYQTNMNSPVMRKLSKLSTEIATQLNKEVLERPKEVIVSH